MSPTFLKYKSFRFYVNSREEERKHVHIQSPDGEVKIWLEPMVEVAKNFGVKEKDLKEILDIIMEKRHELIELWSRHFRM